MNYRHAVMLKDFAERHGLRRLWVLSLRLIDRAKKCPSGGGRTRRASQKATYGGKYVG